MRGFFHHQGKGTVPLLPRITNLIAPALTMLTNCCNCVHS